jgi:hypothetical protein
VSGSATAPLSPFAAKLAAAIARRHALDQIAETGDSVPAQVAATLFRRLLQDQEKPANDAVAGEVFEIANNFLSDGKN